MVEKLHLTRAPIKEALIDLRVRGGTTPLIKEINVEERLGRLYHKADTVKQRQFKVEFDSNKEVATTTIDKELGFRVFSEDELQVIQFREDGFTFSRLPPYQTWEDFCTEAQRLWAVYLDVVNPEIVTRLAVRYINELRIPLPFADFKEYLVSPPDIPDGLPQGLASYLTRLVIPNHEISAVAVVTQALEGVTDQFATVVLDIDVFQDVDIDARSNDFWKTLESLRSYKNDIFFKSITEKTKELFL